MAYIPHTDADREHMLATIGVSSIDDLFVEIPENLRFRRLLEIPPALDENHLYKKLFGLAAENVSAAKYDWYLGAGVYDRFVPASVGAIISRGEFLTSYTPYQPEFSQGYLQTIYEFQSMVAEIYGMDVANASMYDGATALAEAALMACAATGRNKVRVSEAVHPHWRQVLETYCWAGSVVCEEIPTPEGRTVPTADDSVACVIVQSPNFFGVIEDLAAAGATAHASGAMFVVAADPVANALLKPPGEFGADVVVGEGQPLGIAMGYGGPLVGLFTCKEQHIRRIPGRIVGKTVDAQGRDGYTMTLRTREQDIRREKATSNICTNEALMALAATVYMSALGKNGLRSVAETSVRNTQYAISKLGELGITPIFGERVFGEVAFDVGRDAQGVAAALLDRNIVGGLPLGPYYPKLRNGLLMAFTENRTRADIDRLAEALQEVLR